MRRRLSGLSCAEHLLQIVSFRNWPHTKDVYKVYESLDQLDLTNQIVIETFRQSIYDALPENLFQ